MHHHLKPSGQRELNLELICQQLSYQQDSAGVCDHLNTIRNAEQPIIPTFLLKAVIIYLVPGTHSCPASLYWPTTDPFGWHITWRSGYRYENNYTGGYDTQ